MKRLIFTAVLVAAFSGSALAQTVQAPITVEQRLAIQIANLTLQNATLSVQLEAIQKELADLKATKTEQK